MSERKKKVELDSQIYRILIVGVSSYLGTALAVGLRDHFELFGTFSQNPVRLDGVTTFPLNCLNGGEIFSALQRLKPQAVLFCAGLTGADDCQRELSTAESLNVKAPAMFFKVLMNACHFFYFSCDQVFGDLDALNAPFSEKTAPHPINNLGRTKLQAETMVLGGKRYTHVFRLANLFGEAVKPHSRKNTWTTWMGESLQAGKRVMCFREQIRSHLYIGDAVRAIRKYLAAPKIDSHIYNLSGKSHLSRFDFAKLYAQKMGYDPSLVVQSSYALDPRSRTPRPENCSLSSAKFEEDYAFSFQTVEDALDEMAERSRSGFTKDWAG